MTEQNRTPSRTERRDIEAQRIEDQALEPKLRAIGKLDEYQATPHDTPEDKLARRMLVAVWIYNHETAG